MSVPEVMSTVALPSTYVAPSGITSVRVNGPSEVVLPLFRVIVYSTGWLTLAMDSLAPLLSA